MYLVSRSKTAAKSLFFISFSGVLIYLVLAFYTFHTSFINMSKTNVVKFSTEKSERFEKDLKYILLWTIPGYNYNLTADGQQTFIHNNCSYFNCYLTTNKELLNKDTRNFDAIMFSINTLKNWKRYLPTKRSPKQKYVFYSMMSANKYPICNVKADNFFNWTWSYKLYSDIVTPFIEVRNLYGEIVAPKYGDLTVSKENTEDTDEINSDDTNVENIKIANKTKALMWVISNCDVDADIISYVQQLKQALRDHSLDFDIFGCGFNKCPKEGCFKILERDYYFYLAHEDSFSEDYVTSEVLKAYHHHAVPIVVGGAEYAKFLPVRSYIDAQQSMERLAAVIQYTIKTPSVYKGYFSWKKLYTIHETNLQKGYCHLCALLHNKTRVETPGVYENFRKWWYYGSLKSICYPKGAERYEEILSYVKTG